MVQSSRKQFSPQQIKQKIYAYCAYQERSHQEVKQKLSSLGMYGQGADELMSVLITDGYLNEERFAKAFAGGKFRVKNWGRVKIRRELESKGLTKNCIQSGMLEIDDQDYRDKLEKLLRKKSLLIKGTDVLIMRDKLARFAISKGFETDLVWKIVEDLFKR